MSSFDMGGGIVMRKLWLILLFGVLFMSTVRAQEIRSWQKYVAADRSWSFHYPKGWSLKPNGAIVELTSGEEQILFIALPADARKSAQQVARDTIQIFKKDMPDLTATDWRTGEGAESQVAYFKSTYTQSGNKYFSDGLVLKQTGQSTAVWISYSGPANGYSQPRATAILRGVLGSFASGADSQPPPDVAAASPSKAPARQNPQPQSRMIENAQAFLFMLEFIISAPFTTEQEKVILDELLGGWQQKTDAELVKFDAYQQYVAVILHGGTDKVEQLRKAMEKALQEWMADYPDDPGVKAIKLALAARGKVLVDAPQPLTAMAAQSVAEMLAYSHLLNSKPDAMPAEITAAAVMEQKQRVIAAWKSLSPETRTSVAGTPGLWVATRALLHYGNAEDISKARTRMLNMTGVPAAGAAVGAATTTDAVGTMIRSNSLQMIQQQTFNTYMWSRGFNYTVNGKMW
jgi:hypothetical protein